MVEKLPNLLRRVFAPAAAADATSWGSIISRDSSFQPSLLLQPDFSYNNTSQRQQIVGCVNTVPVWINSRCIVLVSNCLQCQIVRGVKLYSVKLSWCQIVLMSNYLPTWAVSNCPRCQIVLGPSFGRANVILCGLSYNSINPINQIKVQSRPCFNKATKEKNDSGQNFSRGENLFHLPSDPLLCCLFHLPRSVLAFIWRIPPFFLWTGSERGQYALFTFTAGVPLPILGAFFDKK